MRREARETTVLHQNGRIFHRTWSTNLIFENLLRRQSYWLAHRERPERYAESRIFWVCKYVFSFFQRGCRLNVWKQEWRFTDKKRLQNAAIFCVASSTEEWRQKGRHWIWRNVKKIFKILKRFPEKLLKCTKNQIKEPLNGTFPITLSLSWKQLRVYTFMLSNTIVSIDILRKIQIFYGKLQAILGTHWKFILLDGRKKKNYLTSTARKQVVFCSSQLKTKEDEDRKRRKCEEAWTPQTAPCSSVLG